MRAVWRHSTSKGTARLVLLALADEANSQGLVTAYRRSQSWIARKANVDGSSVRRAIKALGDSGELEVLARGDGRDSSNYRLTLPDLDPIEGVHDATPGPSPREASPGTTTPEGVHDATPIIPVSPGDNPVVSQEPLVAVATVFARFWLAYPRKVGKPEAEKAWRAMVAKPKVDPAVVMAGLDRWLAYWKAARTALDYHPHPSTWLRQARWNDTPTAATATDRGPRAPITAPREGQAGRVVDL